MKVLDGGFAAWVEADFELETGENTPSAATDFGVEVPARKELIISTPEDLNQAKEDNSNLVLAASRTWDEFASPDDGDQWEEGTGEPLGATFAGAYNMFDDQGKLVPAESLVDEWADWGITADKETVYYCGAAWRAATPVLIALDLGFENVRLFDGSWLKWYEAHLENPEAYPMQHGNPKDNRTFKVKKQ